MIDDIRATYHPGFFKEQALPIVKSVCVYWIEMGWEEEQ